MASARYAHFSCDRPAREMRPSLVMYTACLSVMFATCASLSPVKENIPICRVTKDQSLSGFLETSSS